MKAFFPPVRIHVSPELVELLADDVARREFERAAGAEVWRAVVAEIDRQADRLALFGDAYPLDEGFA